MSLGRLHQADGGGCAQCGKIIPYKMLSEEPTSEKVCACVWHMFFSIHCVSAVFTGKVAKVGALPATTRAVQSVIKVSS